MLSQPSLAQGKLCPRAGGSRICDVPRVRVRHRLLDAVLGVRAAWLLQVKSARPMCLGTDDTVSPDGSRHFVATGDKHGGTCLPI